MVDADQNNICVSPALPEVVPTKAPAKKIYRSKKCARQGCCVEFVPSGAGQKFCDEHRIIPGTDSGKADQTERKARSRAKQAAELEAKARKYNSDLEPSKPEALELLARHVHDRNVREVCHELGLAAARKHEIPANRFFWTNGLAQTLRSFEKKRPQSLELDHDTIIPSEVVRKGDLYFIYDLSVSFREPEGTFQHFIEERRRAKADWVYLGQHFLQIPFEDKPHRDWAAFLPSFEPTLPPGYTLQQMREWLSKQKSPTHPVTTRDWLLQAPRGSMKSTASLALAVQAILCAPSLRLLLISETTKLSKDFIKLFRSFWELGSSPAYERFQYFFPEFMVQPGDGSVLSFTSPMRGFVLPQETAEAASMEVAAAGRRFDIAFFDDCISEKSVTTHELREKILNTYDALTKLREAGQAGITITIGTPWLFPPVGEIGDLYWELMKRNEEDPEHSLAVMAQPAWVLKPESAHKFPTALNQLTDADVQELLFPSGSRLTFKELIKEARKNIDLFRSQFLVEYIETEESRWTPTFTLEELHQKTLPLNFFDAYPLVMTVAAVDTASSKSIVADRSSICIAKIYQYHQKNVAFVVDVIVGRWKYSELAVEVVNAFQRYGVQRAVIEKNGVPWEDFVAATNRVAYAREYALPSITPLQSKGMVGTGVNAKLVRVKGAEVLFNNGQLFFAYGPWNGGFFAETVRFKGQRSGSSIGSKDDQIDSLGMLTSTFLVKDIGGSMEPTAEQLEYEEQARVKALFDLGYAAIFGNRQSESFQSRFAPPEPEQVNPFERAGFENFGFMKRNAA